jgi:hypothetical protein
MKANAILLIGFFCITILQIARAEEFENQDAAIKAIQSMLSEPAARLEEANKTSKGKKAIQDVEKLGLSTEGNEKLYQLAGEVMTNLIKDSKGDLNKLNDLMLKAQDNPEKFFSSWTPEQKAKLRAIAKSFPTN